MPFLPNYPRQRCAPQRLALLPALALGALLALPPGAQAGRPLATDDAGTAEPGTCQLEGWHERAGAERAWVLAPACGVAEGLELGADLTRHQPRGPVRSSAGLALKWAPAAARLNTAAGELGFGLKLATSSAQTSAEGWQREGSEALALASWQAAEAWAVHANLGAARQHGPGGQRATLLNLALAWTPGPSALLFAELQANSRREAFGGTQQTLGGRWWLVPERLGLDLTASREAGAAGPTRWGLGFGWYGIGR
ncbi:MAG: hypothetical protein HY855_09185 [Burkholderiales bacterium]|nr:hypothetical protein [Burkholderiales bacterium]